MKMKTSRELAMEWWNSLPDFSRTKDSKNGYCVVMFTQPRSHHSLTGREIEEIWVKEHPNLVKSADELDVLLDEIFSKPINK